MHEEIVNSGNERGGSEICKEDLFDATIVAFSWPPTLCLCTRSEANEVL